MVRENQPKLLTKLLQICFERFKNVVQAHGVLLTHLQRTRNVYKRGKETYFIKKKSNLVTVVKTDHPAAKFSWYCTIQDVL